MKVSPQTGHFPITPYSPLTPSLLRLAQAPLKPRGWIYYWIIIKKNPYLFYSSPTEGKHPFRLAAVSFSCLQVVSLSDVGVGEHDRKLSFMSLTRCFLPEISWWWWSLELDWIHISVAVEFSPHEESPSLSLFTSGIKCGVFTVSLIRFQHWSMEETTKKT